VVLVVVMAVVAAGSVGCGGDDDGSSSGGGGSSGVEAAEKEQVKDTYLVFWDRVSTVSQAELVADSEHWFDGDPQAITRQMVGMNVYGGQREPTSYTKHTVSVDLSGEQAVVHDCFVDDVKVLDATGLTPGGPGAQTEQLQVTMTKSGTAAIPWRVKEVKVLKTWDGVTHPDCKD
jgi:hypothetical protein